MVVKSEMRSAQPTNVAGIAADDSSDELASAQAEIERLNQSIENHVRTIESLQQKLTKRTWTGSLKNTFSRLVPKKVSRIATRALISINNPRVLSLLAKNRANTLYEPWHLASHISPFPSDAHPPVAISAVTFNDEKWIAKFFKSILQNEYPTNSIDLIFVDHGSSDGTLGALHALEQKFADRFRNFTILESENLGYGAGHNKAIKETNAEHVLVTNVDLELDADSLAKVVSIAHRDADNVACWELRQRPYEHPKYYDPVTLETSWCSHAAILIKRSAYLEVGGYEKRIFMYGEDVELSYRFSKSGFLLRYIPAATVTHHTYETAGQFKALQFAGSIAANVAIRARYGSMLEVLGGIAQALTLRSNGEPSRDKALKQAKRKAMGDLLYYLKSRTPGKRPVPFRRFDYEMIREGAFVTVDPMPVKDNRPLVSIITRTVAGRSALLQQAIVSVLNQTWPNIEHIIVEDGGTSTSEYIVRTVAQRYQRDVKFLFASGRGRSSAGNTGLKAAAGKYVMFLDDDDLLFGDHVEVLVSALVANHDVPAAYSYAWDVPTTQIMDGSSYAEKEHNLTQHFRQAYSAERLKKENFIPIQSILCDREKLLKIGGFHEDLDSLEDWNLWVRLSQLGNFVLVPKLTSLYRTPAEQSRFKSRQKTFDRDYAIVVARNSSDISQIQHSTVL